MRRALSFACGLAAAAAADADAATSAFANAFADPAAWTATGSDQVDASLRAESDALCLAFDFNGVSGFASMRRRLPIDYPDNYAFSFRVRGDAPGNALQFKLADASGDNVWWVNRPDFAFAREPRALRLKKRQIDFAWGPAADKVLRHSEFIEFTIYAGTGGKGEACFDRPAFEALPAVPATWPPPRARASSSGYDAPLALDGDAHSAWRSDPRQGPEQVFTLDLGVRREFGGLVLHWIDDAPASRYDVALSDDGRHWRDVRHVEAGNGGIDPLALPESEARYVRLAMHEGPAASYGLASIEVEPLAFGASTNAFFGALAQRARRGLYPRGILGEQTYWTVVGTDGGHETGLLSEDGALEVARGGFSIEPFLLDGQGHLTTWADATITHALEDRYLPMPRVHWRMDGVELDIGVFAAGVAGDSRLVATYVVRNTGTEPRALTLALALQPFQVNPSVQFLNTPGGVSPIGTLGYADRAVVVDGRARAYTRDAPERFVASAFDAGMIAERLAVRASTPLAPTAEDPTRLASGALLYPLELAPGASRTIALAVPLDPGATAPLDGIGNDAALAAERARIAAQWHGVLDRVALRVPGSAQPRADTLRTALAHILVSRDGAALLPGTRAYARSWIRDGAMMADALLRLGRDDVARAYLDWYAPYQFHSGKVPCCVDARGSDPVAENDSHGELVHLAAEVWRYTRDRGVAEAAWPHVDAAVKYMDALRASERTAAHRTPANAANYGLMPASISHEGYSAKPMHSYWDDFWALTGYKAAVTLAGALHRDADATRIAEARDEFRADLHASIMQAVAAHAIDYLPGCAELGDFDATSTTIALAPAGEQDALPSDLLRGTFERYWREFVRRRDGDAWKDYTPYEWRTVGSFVRLGWRDRAQEAIAFFMQGRRPPEWNQWAEVVGRHPRESRFVGDMPHGWVASDFIRSVLDLFAWERQADDALVLAAGVPDAWLEGDGVAIDGLRTPYGRLSYSLRRDGTRTRLHVERGDLRLPRGGLVFGLAGIESARIRLDGKTVEADRREVRIRALPADLVIDARRAR
ncbi:MAG: discoidin domain-containing protein [Dokdonella sp.]|uniref:discoidin domain-containing protein n=1 Tax=Dokdonella sp. TaxID=2291710 RepID=UPI003F7FE4E6